MNHEELTAAYNELSVELANERAKRESLERKVHTMLSLLQRQREQVPKRGYGFESNTPTLVGMAPTKVR